MLLINVEAHHAIKNTYIVEDGKNKTTVWNINAQSRRMAYLVQYGITLIPNFVSGGGGGSGGFFRRGERSKTLKNLSVIYIINS